MSIKKFNAVMKEKASEEKMDKKKSDMVAFVFKLSHHLAMPIGRISRATGVKPGVVVVEFIASQYEVLEKLAGETEKLAPSERLKEQIFPKRKFNLDLKSVKTYVASKKK